MPTDKTPLSTEYRDYPFQQIHDSMVKQMARGATCYQKWTCSWCGSRQTMDTPNVLFTQGKCEECKSVTNISACNYMFVLPVGRTAATADPYENMECITDHGTNPDGTPFGHGTGTFCHFVEKKS